MDWTVDYFLLLQNWETLEEREECIDDLLLWKLFVGVRSLPYFNFFEESGLLFGVEDTLVEGDAF